MDGNQPAIVAIVADDGNTATSSRSRAALRNPIDLVTLNSRTPMDHFSRAGLRFSTATTALLSEVGIPRSVLPSQPRSDHPVLDTLGRVAEACSAEGWSAKLVTADAEDPLGGVLTITTAGALAVKIVNYYNPLRLADNPGASAIDSAVASIENTALPVVDLAHLIALALYAGGPKSEADVVELLSRNADADLAAIAGVCERFALRDDFARLCRATLGRDPP